MFETPVVDRTINDVKQVENRINNPKGALSHTMLNRIEKNSQYLASLLNSYNYKVDIKVKTDWVREDYFRPSDLDRIKENMKLKAAYVALPTTPSLVLGKKTISHVDANNMEQIEQDLEHLIRCMTQNFIYCGVPRMGRNRIWQQRFRKYNFELYTLKNLLKPISEEEFMVDGGTVACEKSTTHVKYGVNSLRITGDSGDNEKYGVSTASYPLEPTHLYYACVEVYSETGEGSIDFFWKSASPSFFGGKKVYANTWTKWSIVSDRSNFAAGNYPYRLDYNNGGVADNAWFDGAMIIDLTATFGAGNEPSQDWCDKNISYFVGEKIIHKIKEDEK